MDINPTLVSLKTSWTLWLAVPFIGSGVCAFWPGNRARFAAAAHLPRRRDDGEA